MKIVINRETTPLRDENGKIIPEREDHEFVAREYGHRKDLSEADLWRLAQARRWIREGENLEK